MKRFLLALVMITTPATGHEAMMGWHYDPACCSEKDCSPYPAESITFTHHGYLLNDGVFIPFDDERIRVSGDGRYHRCDHHKMTLCFYVPAGS